MQANGVPRDASAVVIYSFISELFIIDFLNHDFASCFILFEMGDIMAHTFLQHRCSYLYLNLILILIRSFGFVPTYKYTYYPLLLAQYFHIGNLVL